MVDIQNEEQAKITGYHIQGTVMQLIACGIIIFLVFMENTQKVKARQYPQYIVLWHWLLGTHQLTYKTMNGMELIS